MTNQAERITIEECYKKIGGNFKEFLNRIASEDLASRLLLMFCDDTGCDELCKAMNDGDMQKAFFAVHSIKGVALNLSLTPLSKSASELTELLRPGNYVSGNPKIPVAVQKVKSDFESIVGIVKEYEEGLGAAM